MQLKAIINEPHDAQHSLAIFHRNSFNAGTVIYHHQPCLKHAAVVGAVKTCRR